ncbi:matrixin family metalloprotease [Paenibacillus sp. FSL H7-0331]|uniref:matrixin family metalloprotease n=1 Tax=Paenibacillus sp. FSL H7-0331 TaxID=1920421 RepID=UPI00096D60FB|nr:matrixin family metalloprotease [Paenibacillus sp. FSL H7-0331]OMF19834.1 hypothetical protein BK127_02695 [Paenibacillus sp. FSL H7-0331]
MKKKFLVIATSLGLALSVVNVAYADTPTFYYKFNNRYVTYYNDGSNNAYKGFWTTGASRWTNNSVMSLVTGYTNDFRAGNTENSGATWDGICYTDYNWITGTINNTRSWLNTHFTAQSRYTTSIINGIATHELGHSFGLAHNDSEASVMLSYTFYSDLTTLARTYDSPTPSDTIALKNKYDGVPHGLSLTEKLNDSEPKTNKEKLKELNIKNPNNKEHVVVVTPSWAVKYTSLKDLAESADLVVKGTVSKNKGTNVKKIKDFDAVTTSTDIEIKSILKGDNELNKKNIVVKQLGGENESTLYFSEHTTPLQEKQEVILFLKKSDNNTYILINENDSLFVNLQSNPAENSTNKVVEGQYQYMADQSIISESDIISKIK